MVRISEIQQILDFLFGKISVSFVVVSKFSKVLVEWKAPKGGHVIASSTSRDVTCDHFYFGKDKKWNVSDVSETELLNTLRIILR